MAKVTNKLKCRICDKKIVQYYMKEHVKTVHDGIKDHQCKICKRKFGQLENMKEHVKTVHDGIKDHQCKICNKKFGRSSVMKEHVKTVHDGIKNHQCEICNMKFVRLSYMKRHHKKVHDGKGQIQSLKHKKQVQTAQKESENDKDSKRMKVLDKEALDVSNIAGFDHENQIVDKEPTIKSEVKIEPLDENIDEGLKNVKVETVEENFDKLKVKIMTEIGLFDANGEEDYMILMKISELIQKKKN